MPSRHHHVTPTLLLAAACSPAAFAWQEHEGERLRRYRESFAAAAGAEIVAVERREDVLRTIAAGSVLWLGDHHRHSRLHGLQLELIEQLRRRGVRMAIGLEAIGVEDQPLVDAFLAGALPLHELRERIRRRWPGSWLDDRELDPFHYRALLTFAGKHGAPVFALEPAPRLALEERDRRIAAAVAAARSRWPDRLIVVVVGQAHLLGEGDVVGRSGSGGVVFGGLPPEPLRAASPSPLPRGAVARTERGVHWFAEMLADAVADDARQERRSFRPSTEAWPSTSSATTR